MKTSITSTQPAQEESAPKRTSWRATLASYWRRDPGQLPVVFALIVIGVFFQITSRGLFLGPRNLTELVLQVTAIGTIGLAAVLVLLIGEIDLTAGVAAYTCASVSAVLSVEHGWNAIFAICAGLLTGALIGLINGVFVAILGVPSFVVTLAGLLAYQGVVIYILYPQTSLIISDPNLANIATTYLPLSLGIAVSTLATALYIVGVVVTRIRRQQNALKVRPIWAMGLRNGVVIAVVVGALLLFEAYLGVPQSAVILLGLVVLFWLILRFTAFGHHVYAVGGNAEATRRAGINVRRIRITVSLASMLAAVGGILSASRLDTATSEVDQSFLLNAIAIAVVGGVSLFGGVGSVWAVVLGSIGNWQSFKWSGAAEPERLRRIRSRRSCAAYRRYH